MKITGKLIQILGPSGKDGDPINSGDHCLAKIFLQVPRSDGTNGDAFLDIPCTAWVEQGVPPFANIAESGEFQVGDGVDIEISQVAK